ncbi:MAG: Gfo/Idh/MocA family oxidoreductase [Candidatus Sumerlaeota bacterium]|nr:Gfo/Idh/MocA family oxidoreductase [Candidatus Sumerlaeota bacterium]
MSERNTPEASSEWSRRDFLRSAASAGAGWALGQAAFAQPPASGPLSASQPASMPSSAPASAPRKADQVNVGIIGVGEQGRVLIEAAVRIPGVRFKAVCDIWPYSQKLAAGRLKSYGHDVTVYEDYRDMLDKEKGAIDAAIVATPDWMHAEHAMACMQAGLHVYCEKEMSNSLEKAKQMVLAQRATGRKLQIGHQRRSNPRYLHAINKLIHEVKLLGRVTHANAQWNRAVTEELGWAKTYELSQETLNQYGYATMREFRNWRWFKKYGGGPIVDLGSHQIDLFSWVFLNNPKSVTASGGTDYYKNYEWYDNVMAIYEFDAPEGVARAFYQVLTTTAHGLFYEVFMGVDGSIEISEIPSSGNNAFRESRAPEWDKWARMGLLGRTKAPPVSLTSEVIADARPTKPLGAWPLPVQLAKPAHQPHLENFFDSIRYGVPLNCPAEIGYETAVAVLRANDAVEAARRLEFKPEEFKV